jgi:hypothetical protein
MTWSSWLLAALPPFLVALGVAGLLRARAKRKGGPKRVAALAETAPVLGFIAGFIAVAQGIPFLNNVAQHRVGEAAVLALAVTIGLALLDPGPRFGRYAALAAAVLALWWQLPAGALAAEQWLAFAGAALVAIFVQDRLVMLARGGVAGLLVLTLAAAALAVIAACSHAGLLGALALALAAGCVGSLVWARPFGKALPALAATIGGGMVFAALGFACFESAARMPWALAPLLACFWTESIMVRLPPLVRLAKKKPQRPLALTVAAALPAGLAVALAVLLP